MKRVIILGAGASKSYDASKTNVRMPIANDFFETFRKLDISANPWVLIGDIINYIADKNNANILDFLNFNEDIEALHTEIQEKLYKKLNNKKFELYGENMTLYKSYTQLIFLFVSVINEIQNGDVSNSHIALANQLNSNDSIITFNWDTLMDRALKETTDWKTDYGYSIIPNKIYRNKWESPLPPNKTNYPSLIKLHGSSNWLTSYYQPKDGKLDLMQETDPDDFFIYESTQEPYNCHSGRYMPNYTDFSYGYYPPNLPLKGKPVPEGKVLTKTILTHQFMPKGTAGDKGLPSMPLIIPPVKHKEYDAFGDIFSTLWDNAKQELIQADKIYIIGYSFPITDIRSNHLFKSAFDKRKQNLPEIIILNPDPENIHNRFINDFCIPKEKINTIKDYFTKDFKL